LLILIFSLFFVVLNNPANSKFFEINAFLEKNYIKLTYIVL
jgi:hypothetical protein